MLRERAPAKVNLTLHVLGRRADGFHELDSLVAFAGCAADSLSFAPGAGLALTVDGPFAAASGEVDDNLILRAARAALAHAPDLRTGAFALTKRIPVAAGLGGGSADAAAALRLLARSAGLGADDPRLVAAAAEVGSDVPACLVPRAAMMRGRGERIDPVAMAPLAAVLLNPLKALSTPAVYRGLGLAAGDARPGAPAPTVAGLDAAGAIAAIAAGRNDLEPPARAIEPLVSTGVDAMAATSGCRLARMSGSGATVFGLFDTLRDARLAARALRLRLPGWWAMPTTLR